MDQQPPASFVEIVDTLSVHERLPIVAKFLYGVFRQRVCNHLHQYVWCHR
jgi:hypothetical protein